ncbi:MAG: LacI family DNA-binding transcriptional regulator [Eubacteriales bacterium]|nr:LacI family DNA-binding transcriptional regulator [Eubacteriales bacterium]
MTTITDIAKAAKVSTATVSRVLNFPETVSPARRERVMRVIEELHYTPNALARELVTKSTKIIGLLLPDITNTFSPTVINSFLQEMNKHGYNTLVCITNADTEKECEYIKMMSKKRVEGFVFLGSRLHNSPNDSYIDQISVKTPVIMLDYLNKPHVSHVMVDEEKGAYLATSYLLELGHRCIAFLNGPLSSSSYYHKHKGFLRAMREAGLEVSDKYQLTVAPNHLGGYEATSELLQYHERPTAIFAAGDQIAVGAYRAAHENGIEIPRDLSVIGFSGSPISMSVYPPLSTVAQYAQEIGEQAAYLMLELLEGKVKQKDIILEPKILQRLSCAPPNAAE